VQRSNRLSRSRDFDVVYRHGRSVSTRFLTLYWFAHTDEPTEPRLGLAVPKAAGSSVERNRIKRRLREIWHAKLGRGELTASNDYVLVVRPGLPEAAEARGHEWLSARVDEVLARVAA
jgi:ribonuclease P protein component